MLWDNLLENKAKRGEAELREVMGKVISQWHIFETLDLAIPEADIPGSLPPKIMLICLSFANKSLLAWSVCVCVCVVQCQVRDWDGGAQSGPLFPSRCTDLDSLPLLVGERFSKVAPLFWGEEVVKEFPESEVFPLLGSRLLLRPPLGLPFSWPRDLVELICVEGGEEVSLPESYSWERPREVVSGLVVLVKRSAADPDPVIWKQKDPLDTAECRACGLRLNNQEMFTIMMHCNERKEREERKEETPKNKSTNSWKNTTERRSFFFFKPPARITGRFRYHAEKKHAIQIKQKKKEIIQNF